MYFTNGFFDFQIKVLKLHPKKNMAHYISLNFSETYDDSWINKMMEDSMDESRVAEFQEEADMVHLAERADTGSGTVENPGINVKYSLGKVLEPGDAMEVHGAYSASTGWFSVNLLDSSGNVLLHFNPRPSWWKTG